MSLDMNPDVRAAWCAALRSGEYRQTQSALRKQEDGGWSYCCLGVLTDLAVKAGVAIAGGTVAGGKAGWGRLTLPDPVVKWAGVPGDNPLWPGREESLAEMNDGGWDFAAIADAIDGGKR